jgi:hypothetical protein
MTDHADLGREVVKDGRLVSLRQRLRWSRNAMAEALLTSPITYSAWEGYPDTRIWTSTAERIGAFYEAAMGTLETAEVDNWVPFYYLASDLGIPQEELMRRYRDGVYQAEDLGVLGLWIHQDDYDRITGRD